MFYREAKAAGAAKCIWAAGPADFFGLSLRRGSNFKYKDCLRSADSLNYKKKTIFYEYI